MSTRIGTSFSQAKRVLQSAASTAAAWIFISHAAAASIIGEDDRRPPDAEDSVLQSAVGLIFCTREIDNTRRRSAGTATIVGNRSTLLTAAHVFEDEAGRQGPRVLFDPVQDCVFRQYDDNGALRVELDIRRAAMGAFRRNAGLPNEDWAILETTSPLPTSSAVIPFSDRTSDLGELAGMPVRMIAFHADLGRGRRSPLLSEGELIRVNYGGFTRLAHTADTGRMSSGAAIVLRTTDGHNIVVGVNRSSANFADFNLAVPLTAELSETLKSFAHGQVPVGSYRIADADRGPPAPDGATVPIVRKAPAGSISSIDSVGFNGSISCIDSIDFDRSNIRGLYVNLPSGVREMSERISGRRIIVEPEARSHFARRFELLRVGGNADRIRDPIVLREIARNRGRARYGFRR